MAPTGKLRGKGRCDVFAGKTVDVIYIDFSRAFDSVVHSKLLVKLETFGICGKLLSWITAFLRASAMLKHVIAIGLTSVRPSVCPSVRPSHAGTLSKRLNILSCFLHHTIAHSF